MLCANAPCLYISASQPCPAHFDTSFAAAPLLALVSLKAAPGQNCRAILAASMNRSIKTFLVWLLLAVLPLHAVAASRMSCGPVHSQSSQSLIDIGAQSHEHMVDAHAHHGGEHAGQPDDTQVDADSADSKAGKKPHSTCSACSAFCLGAVAPPSMHLTVPAFDGSNAIIVAPAAFTVGFIQDGPQRPPRHQSA